MTLRKPHTIKSLGLAEIDRINQDFDRVYAVKMESRSWRGGSTSGIISYVYQKEEHGEAPFSAAAAPTIVRTFALAERHGRILYADAHARNTNVIASVTDITNTSIQITCRTVSGTANFSAVTTAAITVGWRVVGSDS